MSLLSTLKVDGDIQGESDTVGQSGPWETDIYATKVTMAYLQKSSGGAMAVNLHLESDKGRELRQALWITSGDEKGNLPYFEKDGERKYLPGYNHANSLCLLTVGKEITEMDTEEKVVNLYSFEAKSEVPTKVDVLTELLGQEVYVAVEKQITNKRAKGGDGKYHPTGETREVNEIDKFFRISDKMTTSEIIDELPAPAFYDTWLTKKAGVTRDRSTGVAGTAGTAGAPAPAAGGTPGVGQKASLFGKK